MHGVAVGGDKFNAQFGIVEGGERPVVASRRTTPRRRCAPASLKVQHYTHIVMIGVWREWRLDKAQNFLIEGPATFRIRELGTHDLAGEAAHRGEECFGAAMFGDGFVEPIGLFLGER